MFDLVDANWIDQLRVTVQVVIAGLLGGLIGLERELANRPAGLRTHAILAAAAALLVGTADMLVEHFTGDTPASILRADPIRVVEAIVTGVAFLGAGTIFRNKESNTVEGLTTAASMLLVAAIGIAVALRQLLLAGLITLVTLILLRVVALSMNKQRDKPPFAQSSSSRSRSAASWPIAAPTAPPASAAQPYCVAKSARTNPSSVIRFNMFVLRVVDVRIRRCKLRARVAAMLA